MQGSDLSAFVTTFIRIVGSAIAGDDGAVTVGGFGSTGALDDGADVDDPDDGETITDATVFGGLGLIFRPRTPKKIGDQLYSAESFGVKKGDETTPWTWRDLRLHKRFPNPKEGTIALVGYGGGFLSFDDPADNSGDGGVTTWYLPYAFSGGSATKAHVITMSGDSESLAIIHGDGFALSMDPTNGITMRADAQTWLTLKPGLFQVFAASCQMQGNVALGQNLAAALPLLPGIASQPTPSVFFSPA